MARAAHVVAALAVGCAGVAGVVGAQAFPGEAPRTSSFPSSVSVFLLGGWTGDRAIRTYDEGFPNPNDPACDSIRCRTVLGASSAPGVGLRVQLPVSRGTGVRVGLSFAVPRAKIRTLSGTQVRLRGDRVAQVRAELLLLFRIKPRAPVFLGVGGAFTRYNPGLAPAQDNATDAGGVVALGLDRPLKPPFGVRLEWTAYLMVPGSGGWPAEYEPRSFAFDHQFSVALQYAVVGRRR
jgi:hypothetical protein